MAYTTENTIEIRRARVENALALKEPDRVPFAPKLSMAYCQTGGIDVYEGMVDPRNMEGGLRKFLGRYELDLLSLPSAYPIPAMETLATEYIKWPGAANDLALNTGFQILDKPFMEEDEYDEFLSDPSHFLMTKVFPRRHKNLAALSKIGFRNIFSAGHFASMQSFSDPDVIEALLTLAAAGKQMKQWNAGVTSLSGAAAEMQTIVANQAGQLAPYDMLADMLRGYLNVPMDLFLIPDKVEAAIGVMETIAMQSVAQMKQRGVEFCFMPLHGGTDDFMSDETYRKYYWPSLQRVIEKLISCEITPYVFCEGKYNTRLDVIKEVPKGKVIYMFEQVDIVMAKETLRDAACIGGNVPGASLVFGKKEDVVEETKRMIDACAPGGGFIMDCSIVLDHYNEEVFEAWYDTTINFGKY
jgi:hypothetical protein